MQTTLFDNDSLITNNPPKPFLKWAGGKTQLLTELYKHLPTKIKESEKIEKYFEPFVGGGALFFYLASHYEFEEVYLSDINEELILTYKVIQNNPNRLIKRLKYYSNNYLYKSEEEKKEYYYHIREIFNESRTSIDFNNYSKEYVTRAAQMIFLNKTCFNGLFRVNKKGEFNVPCAYPKKPLICDKENILSVSEALENVRIETANYFDCENLIDDRSLVYLDPPYRPLDNKSSFNGYSKFNFDDNSQIELANFYKRISKKGAKVLLSNSDPKNTDPDDEFFDNLYSDFKIDRLKANRFINSKGNKRGPITEILVYNF